MVNILTIALLAVIIILLLLIYLVCNEKTYRLATSLDGPKMYPLVGCLEFVGLNQEQSYQLAHKYSSIYPNGYRYWSFGIFIYNIYSADSVQKIVTNPKHIDKSFSYKLLEIFLGTGLLTSSGEKWFQRRKLMTPAFHFKILKNFHTTFKEQSLLFINSIREEELDKGNGTNLQKYLSRFTLNAVSESAMGVKLKRVDELDNYRKQIYEIGMHHIKRFLSPWLIPDFTYNWMGFNRKERDVIQQVHQFTGTLIKKRREQFLETIQTKPATVQFGAGQVSDVYELQKDYRMNERQQLAMLDTLLWAEHNGQQIDIQGIQEEVDTFVFEGYDTTMTALTFILFMIACHESVQEKLYDEIKGLAINGDRDFHLYSKLKYMDRVIKESLRLYPPVPFIGRRLGEETVLDGVKYPMGTYIHILISDLHRDPKYFPNPETFDPDRFLNENSENWHPFAYIPFSAGKRNCLGQKFAMQEMKTLISDIILNFHLKPITKVTDLDFIMDIVLRTKTPVRIQFEERKHS